MTYDEGASVLAIRDSDDTTLYVYGEGVYVGDRLRPGAAWPCSPDDYQMMAAVVTKNDEVPIEEHEFVHFYDLSVEANPDIPPKKDRETMIADLLVEREQPLDDRVRKLWEGVNENPCIYLDSGDVVWGFQCWWGPLDRADTKFPPDQIPRVLVPVPEHNGRWRA